MKKNLPLDVLKALQPLEDENLNLIYVVHDSECLLHLKDKDSNSDFFYKIKKQEIANGIPFCLTEYKPKSEKINEQYTKNINQAEIQNSIKTWLTYIKSYNSLITIFDDPILKAYQESFETKFDILDEDADFKPFDLNQQLFLDEYLNNIKPKLIKLKESRSGQDLKGIEELEQDVLEIQKCISKESKRRVIKRFSGFWAKCQKIGIDVIKEVFISCVAELTKQLLIGS